MPNVQADPEKLRQFAKVLANSSEQYRQLGKQIQRSLAATGWNDAERRKFEADLSSTLRALNGFADRLKNEYVPKLQKKASALDQFRS